MIVTHTNATSARKTSTMQRKELIVFKVKALLPVTWAMSIPFSAASFLARGLANTLPFLGAAGAVAGAAVGAAGAGAGAGAAT